MKEVTKYDVVCLERGDVDYIKYVADQLSNESVPSLTDLNNYAEALRGIAHAATDLEGL